MNDKQKAKQTLASFHSEGFLFADTETTGFTKSSELVEIAIVDHEGNVQLDTLIKPKGPNPKEASDIHGITDEMVKDAPSWEEVHQEFLQVLDNKTLVFYNRSFDARLLKQTAAIAGLGGIEFDDLIDNQTVCAMKPYAMFNGERNKSNKGYKTVKLPVAAEQEGVVMTDFPGGAHRALYDAVMVQRMCKNLADGPASSADEVTVF